VDLNSKNSNKQQSMNILFSDFGARFNHSLSLSNIENLDLSNNALEDKGNFHLNMFFFLSYR
jgi:hypothetical protein